eukprot:scaffold216437_cov13-Tisochrysis_lutea.AAC.1
MAYAPGCVFVRSLQGWPASRTACTCRRPHLAVPLFGHCNWIGKNHQASGAENWLLRRMDSPCIHAPGGRGKQSTILTPTPSGAELPTHARAR